MPHPLIDSTIEDLAAANLVASPAVVVVVVDDDDDDDDGESIV